MYILFKDGNLTEHTKLIDIVNKLNITITDDGKVFINNKKDTISYNMDVFTKDEAYNDFANTRLFNFQKQLNIKLYKCY